MAADAIGGEFPITGDGTKVVICEYNMEVKMPVVTAVTVGLTIDTNIYGADDATGTTATTLGPVIGPMTKWVSANVAWIHLRGNKGTAAA